MKLHKEDFLINLNRVIINEFLDEFYGHMLIVNRTKYQNQFTKEDLEQFIGEIKNFSVIGWKREPNIPFSSFISVDISLEYKGNNQFIKETIEYYKSNYNLK